MQHGSLAHLDHEVADAAVEGGVGVVARLGQNEEVLAGAGHDVAVQLQIEVPQAGVQAHVSFLLGLALHPDPGPRVLGDHVHSCRGERARRSTYKPIKSHLGHACC